MKPKLPFNVRVTRAKSRPVWKFLLIETDMRIIETIEVDVLQNLHDHNKSVLVNHVLNDPFFTGKNQ